MEDNDLLLKVPRKYLQKITSSGDPSTSAALSLAEIVREDMAKFMTQLKTKFDTEGFECYKLAYDSDDDSDISLLPDFELQALFD